MLKRYLEQLLIWPEVMKFNWNIWPGQYTLGVWIERGGRGDVQICK